MHRGLQGRNLLLVDNATLKLGHFEKARQIKTKLIIEDKTRLNLRYEAPETYTFLCVALSGGRGC